METHGRWPWVAAGLVAPASANAVMHTALAIRERRYNPGVVTVTLLMAPHAAAGGRWLARSRRLARRERLIASVAGIAFAGLPLAMKIRMRHAHDGRATTVGAHGRAGPPHVMA
jgi:hypothetical protein